MKKQVIIIGCTGLILMSLLILILGCGGGGSGVVPNVPTNTPVNIITATPTPVKYGNISGKILNTTNTGYANAFVLYQSLVVNEKIEASGLFTKNTTSDPNGAYSFTNVPQGPSRISFWSNQSSYQTDPNSPLGAINSEVGDNTVGAEIREGQIAPTPTATVTPGGPTLTPPPTVTPGGPTLTSTPTSVLIQTPTPTISIGFSKLVTFTYATRPEIVVTDDRVFVVYHSLVNPASFSVKIFNRDMTSEITTKVLVPTTTTYGSPTDIRVTSAGGYLYTFYETAIDTTSTTYLFGAKYTLDDNFTMAGSTGLVATGKKFTQLVDGDERLDDPIVLVGENSVFGITRYKASLATSGATRYKVYEFTKNLSAKVRDFDLDLSSVADGAARQSSAIYHEGYYYMAIGTTVGPAGAIEYITPSDLVIVKLDTNWNIIESHNISTDNSSTDDAETYITGFKADANNFYLDYLQINIPTIGSGGFTVPLKIYNWNFDLVINQVVRVKQTDESGLRPSLELTADQIFVGNSGGTMGSSDAEIYIYNISR